MFWLYGAARSRTLHTTEPCSPPTFATAEFGLLISSETVLVFYTWIRLKQKQLILSASRGATLRLEQFEKSTSRASNQSEIEIGKQTVPPDWRLD